VEKVVIIGAGSFGREVIEIFKCQNKEKKSWDILGFLDDNKKLHEKEFNGFSVLGGLEWLKSNDSENLYCVIAIGTPKIQRIVFEKVKKYGARFTKAIHPSVIMSDSIELGQGVILCAGCILTINIKIGNFSIINMNSTIGHDVVVGDFCVINPAVKINGEDVIGDNTVIGTGATLIDEISVGENVTIGAGAVVIKPVPDNVVVFGVPAKIVMHKKHD